LVNQPSPLQFLYLTTIGWKTGRQHRIEIWFVEYNKRYYVMSERRQRAHWVQNIIHNPKVLFTLNHDTFESIARIVNKDKETNLIGEVSNLMSKKYQWNDGLIVELTEMT
jgi:hypothetical protein